MTIDLDVDQLRADTPGCANVIHLNNAGSALPPEIVTRTMVDHLLREQAIGGYDAAAEAAGRVDATRGSVARLVGGRPDQIAIVESATHAWARGLAAVANTLTLGPEDRILTSSAEYTSNVIPLMQLAARTGAQLEFIPDGEDGALDVGAFEEMLDDDVVIVAVNQCPSQNGLVNDVAAVGRALRPTEAWYLVDACQSVGQLPVDAAQIGADFLSATGRKFLRGPRAIGFLYASDAALAELEPFPLDLESGIWTATGYEVAPTARRFEYWEKPYASILGLGAAVDYALGCGIDSLAERIGALAEFARVSLAEIPGVVVRDRGSSRSGIVTFTHDRVPAGEIVAALKAAGVNAGMSTALHSRIDMDRHGVTAQVRLSPHAYNTEEEISRAVEVVARAT